MIFRSENLSLAEFVQYASPEQLVERRDEIAEHLAAWQAVMAVVDDRSINDIEDYADEVEQHCVKQCDYDTVETELKQLRKEKADFQRFMGTLRDEMRELDYVSA